MDWVLLLFILSIIQSVNAQYAGCVTFVGAMIMVAVGFIIVGAEDKRLEEIRQIRLGIKKCKHKWKYFGNSMFRRCVKCQRLEWDNGLEWKVLEGEEREESLRRTIHIHHFKDFEYDGRKMAICVSKNGYKGCGKLIRKDTKKYGYVFTIYDPRVIYEDEIPNPRRWVSTPEYYLSKFEDSNHFQKIKGIALGIGHLSTFFIPSRGV